MKEKENVFLPLAEMFPDERFDEIGKLFDDGKDCEANDDQWKLNGLAMLLDCLENLDDEVDANNSLAYPLICKIQALQAAYCLGKNSQKEVS